MQSIPPILSSAEIDDSEVLKLLAALQETGASLVLWGGAVRDILFNLCIGSRFQIRDLDLAPLLPVGAGMDGPLHYLDYGAPFRILPTIRDAWRPLACSWLLNLGQLVRQDGVQVHQVALPIDMMGLRVVKDRQGNPFPDCFACTNGRTFCAVPFSLSINRFAIDGSGRLYGPRRYLSDFLQRKARFLAPPMLIVDSILLLARLVEYIERFELIFTPTSATALLRHLCELEDNPTLVRKGILRKSARSVLIRAFGEDTLACPPTTIVSVIRSKLFN